MTETKIAASRRCGERERKAKPRGSCLTRAGIRRKSLQAGDEPWRDATRDPRGAASLPPATHACAPHAASILDLGRGTRPGSGYDPRGARPATARGCAHARRHLGPSTGQDCRPRAPRPGLAGGLAHAQRRLSKRPRAGLSPQGLLSQLPRPEVGQRGAGRGGFPLGGPARGRIRARRPLLASCALPSALTSTQAQTTSARPPGSPLLLGWGTGATSSWRLPQKQPGLGGMHPDARSRREEEGSGPEGRGGGRAMAPRPSSPLPPCRPRPRPLSRL